MAQQTAVDWVIEQLCQLAHNPKTHIGMGDVRVTQGYLDELKEQAKPMEREQHKISWVVGNDTQRCNNAKEVNECFDNYYNETYGSGLQNETN